MNNLFVQGGIVPPSKYSFEWHINNLDLCAYEKKTEVLFNINLGHI